MLNASTNNVDALLIIREIHTRDVDLNAQQTQIAAAIEHVCVANVLIHVLEFVDRALFVKSLIIFQSALVHLATQEIHFQIADQIQSQSNQK